MDANSFLNDGRILPEDVLDALVNLKQLVFEVTDACNLKCKYCAYGELYFGYDKRSESFLSIDKGKAMIDYLCSIWNSHAPNAARPVTYISFYGGEPLMNMNFIEEIVAYVEEKNAKREFIFAMTTNGILLDRYIEYLADHGFNLLISLDGDSQANAHRVTHAGESSFERVYANVRRIQQIYPYYFREHVNFNTVLHNLNSVSSSYKFFLDEFGKETTISELNTSNIREDKVEEFLFLYKNKSESIANAPEREELASRLMMGNPKTYDLLIYLHQYSGNVYKNYSDLFINREQHHFCPTGTCIPFGKKMFVTVSGKVLQCEKIAQHYALGHIDENNKVVLNFDEITTRFNACLDKMQPQCSRCFRKQSCSQCLYYIHGIDGSHPKCQAFMGKAAFNGYVGECLSHLYDHPELYEKLLRDIIVD